MNRLFEMIEKFGWKGRMVSIDHLDDLQAAIYSRYEQGLIDTVLYKAELDFFSFDLPSDLSDARSIIVIAVPTAPMRITFHWKRRQVPVVIPPTYVNYTPRTESVQEVLASWLSKEGYRMVKPDLPLKTLAVSSGLAYYGRNNICYVPGLGSFLQLVGAISDMPCDNDSWHETKALNRCDSCVACIRQCPTKAITKERFLLYAERCLTYHNESVNEFPNWIDPSWHHCLIGCMRCQTICPENKGVVKWFEDRVEFSEEETDLFIRRVPFSQLPYETIEKFKSLEINEDYKFLCRNLSMIIGRTDLKV